MPWLFTGTISVRSRFTGPTPVARFSIAVVVLDGVAAHVELPAGTLLHHFGGSAAGVEESESNGGG